ncbi:MAG: PASTA domain-containing protein [Deltaproteobacteria bacterium]|nr:PASTA domain-containing protein [Deltaproteobacteria bacterium]
MNNLPPRRIAWIRLRIALLALLLFAGAGAVVYRAWDLQVRDSEELRKMAEKQYLRNIRLAPKRGSIYDRNGAEMAVSVDVDSVWANPLKLRQAKWSPAEAARRLASVLKVDEKVIAKRLAYDKHFVWIKRQVTPHQVKQVCLLEIPGVEVLQEARRFYPNRELAAHVLGFVNIDGVGIEGLEFAYEDRLHGSFDSVPAIRDRRGRVVFSEQLLDQRAAQGDDLYLTIDKSIQRAAERELELTIRTFEARAGSVVVLDPLSGEILAMANYPIFNPNHFEDYPQLHRRNRAVTDRFEPGSTTKIFTVAGALAKGAIRPDQLIDCEKGVIQVAENWIHDTRKWEMLTPAQILTYSSNIGAAKIGLSMGRASLFRTLRRFGFGQPSDIELPGETSGILPHYKRWYEMDAATISFGQGLSVNTVQLALAMGAIANRGRLMKPILVKRIADARGQTVEESLPQIRRQAVPAWDAELIGDMLTGVTEKEGTAEEAAIDDYLVAGKTGTAQKADYINGGYAKDQWIASFIGFVPLQHPRVVIAVVIDEPIIAHQGGTVAAPLFRRLGRATLRHLGVPPDSSANALAEYVRRRREQARQSAEAARVESGDGRSAESAGPGNRSERAASASEERVIVPNLIGKNARAALGEIRELDLAIRLKGSGLVAYQKPAGGESLARGGTVQVQLKPPVYEREPSDVADNPLESSVATSIKDTAGAQVNARHHPPGTGGASRTPISKQRAGGRTRVSPEREPTKATAAGAAADRREKRFAELATAASRLVTRVVKESD